MITGFRTPSDHLTTTQSFNTLQLSRMVRVGKGAWDAALCLRWGDEVLRWIRGLVQPSEVDENGQEQGRAPVWMWHVAFIPRKGALKA